MKADAPVSEGLDSSDIAEQFVAKGWVSGEFGILHWAAGD